MLIRLEITDGKERKGIYQCSIWTIDDYCSDALQLPIPDIFKDEDWWEEFFSANGNVSCWFTEKGFQEYGIYFGSLLCNSTANKYWQKDNYTILVGTMPEENPHTIIWEDDYQVVFLEYEVGEYLNQFVPLTTKDEWMNWIKNAIKQTPYLESFYSAMGWVK